MKSAVFAERIPRTFREIRQTLVSEKSNGNWTEKEMSSKRLNG